MARQKMKRQKPLLRLKPGDVFHTNPNSNNSQKGYKINDDIVYLFPSGHIGGGRQQMSPHTLVEATGERISVSLEPTPIERVACMFISEHRAVHPVLEAWRTVVANDANEHRSIHEFAWDWRGVLEPLCRKRGLAFPKHRADRDIDLCCGERDRILFALVCKVIEYRQNGRVDCNPFESHTEKLEDAIFGYHNSMLEI